MYGVKRILTFRFCIRVFPNSVNLMIFLDLVVKILRITLSDLKKEVKFILKIGLIFVQAISLIILLKMKLMK